MLPTVYPVIDTGLLRKRQADVLLFTAALLGGGATLVQYRHKGAYTRDVFDELQAVARMCDSSRARLIVNDRADVARLVGSGVHVGQDDLPPADARRVAGADCWVGYSTHNEEQLTAGNREPVDYLAIGPIFATQSKEQPDPVVGLDELKRLAALSAVPLVAIGGITLDTAPAVLAAGAHCVAVISGLVPDAISEQAVRTRMEEWLKATRQ